MRYLNPKADLTFKRVFGEHPDLVMSLLNALLPLEADRKITEIEYLPSEMVPENPLRKNSIVDVRCKDAQGRHFLVEMQMLWSPEFKQRVLFNASKAYVRQLDAGNYYHLLQPVYSLNLVNEVFEPELEGFYHHYRLVHVENSDRIIDGLQLVFVELPKFVAHTYGEKKMQVLWLRYLTEIDEHTREVPVELMENPDIRKAVSILEESAFTPAQLQGYEDFWDGVSVERTMWLGAKMEGYRAGHQEGHQAGHQEGLREGLREGFREGHQEGHQEGLLKGKLEGRLEGQREGFQEGEKSEKLKIARKMKTLGGETAFIAQVTGLSEQEIKEL